MFEKKKKNIVLLARGVATVERMLRPLHEAAPKGRKN